MANRNLAVVQEATALATEDMFSDSRVQMIRDQVARDAPPHIFSAMIDIAKRRKLDPLAKQISLIKFGGNWTIITTIDGYRAIAEQTGHYAGSDAPVFTYTGEKTQAGKNKPDTCTVTVHKLINGQTYPFSAMVYFEEYDTGRGNWSTMPRTMLAKVAESHALRKAFPAVMSGMYEESEMDQAIEGTARVTGSRAHVDQDTGEIQEPDPQAAMKRLHAVAAQHGITHDDLHRQAVAVGRNSLSDYDPQTLHKTADAIEQRPDDAKAYYERLRNAEGPAESQPEPTEQTDEAQAELAAVGDAVGAEFDAQHRSYGDA